MKNDIMVQLSLEERLILQGLVLRLEEAGTVTRTFRRLDPQRQLAVVEALLTDAAEYGPDKLNVKRAAAAAGVAIGSLYQYFPDRQRMLTAAAELAAQLLTASLDSYVEAMGTLDLRTGLAVYLSAGTEWTQQHAGLLHFFARAAYAGMPEYSEIMVRPVAESMRAMLLALLSGAKRRGELREDLDLDDAVRLTHALTAIVADTALLAHLNDYLLLHDERHQPQQVHAATVDFLVRALAVNPEGGNHA